MLFQPFPKDSNNDLEHTWNQETSQDMDTSEDLIVTPGHIITSDVQFMRGHGTYTQSDSLVSSLAGRINRVNKLISVTPFKSRFNGEIGDVVIGRITELGSKRWKVDINARQDAILLLSSIILPGGVQRRKSESDEHQMSSFFAPGDLLSAEVQQFFQDGAASLQTRNFKYGKLRNGSLVIVPSSLIRRSKSHFISLACGVDVILGLNGYIWVCKHVEMTQEIMDQDPDRLYTNDMEEMDHQTRDSIARVCNCIDALSKRNIMIDESRIANAYEISLDYNTRDLLLFEIQQEIIDKISFDNQ